jgi:alanine dehydrogenase
MLLISNEDVEKVLPMDRCVELVESGFRDVGLAEALDTGRSDVYTATSQSGLFHRAAVLRGTNRRQGILSVRIMSHMAYFTEQGTQEQYCLRPGLFCGLILLFDTTNGEPLAVMQDGVLQHLTVGAGAAVGVKYLAREDSTTLGVLGSGGQAQTITEAIFVVRRIRKMKVYSPTREHRNVFADAMRARHKVDCEICDHPREVLRGSDIVVSATDSIGPTFEAGWLEDGTHLTHTNWDEIDLKLYDRADIVCNHVYSLSGAGGDGAPLRLSRGFPSWAVATEAELKLVPRTPSPPVPPGKRLGITDVILGKARGRENDRQITVCSAGGAQRFTHVGGAVYKLVKDAGLGREIPTEWFLQTIRD